MNFPSLIARDFQTNNKKAEQQKKQNRTSKQTSNKKAEQAKSRTNNKTEQAKNKNKNAFPSPNQRKSVFLDIRESGCRKVVNESFCRKDCEVVNESFCRKSLEVVNDSEVVKSLMFFCGRKKS